VPHALNPAQGVQLTTGSRRHRTATSPGRACVGRPVRHMSSAAITPCPPRVRPSRT
jgi:hypothetical protein